MRMPSSIWDTFTSSEVVELQSLKELPESYTWGSSVLVDEKEEGIQVPVVDLYEGNAEGLIGEACKSWGVFQVTNHGIPKRVLDEMEETGNTLFGLPIQQKMKAARSGDGVSGYGPPRISAFFPKKMWTQGFTIVGSPLQHARLLWPHHYTKFCDIIEEYEKEMNKLAGKLLWLILGSLGVSNKGVKWEGSQKGARLRPGPFKGSSGAIQLNSYPACPDPGRAMGLAAHTDSTLLTILHQSSGASGLQVHHEGAGWVMVPPLPGALIVNVGDLLQILSNGQYPSVYHRAVVNRTHHRLSVAYLYGPGPRTRIRPISKLNHTNQPPLYRAVTWSEYLNIKGKYFNKALSLVRLNDNVNSNKDNKDNDNHKYRD